MKAAQLTATLICAITQAAASSTCSLPMIYRTAGRPFCKTRFNLPNLPYSTNACASVTLVQSTPQSLKLFHLQEGSRSLHRRLVSSAPIALATTTAASQAMSTDTASVPSETIPYLSQADAIAVDQALMGPELGFSVDQLMELAGLGVAAALAAEFPPLVAEAASSAPRRRRVLVLAGPGNNGGDGLVAARHLHHFGYEVKVCYPKPTDKPLYNGLVKQISTLGIPLVPWSELEGAGANAGELGGGAATSPLAVHADVVIDALFGFSFSGEPRPPFDQIIRALLPAARPPPIVSVDIPSGWHVEEGDSRAAPGAAIQPDMLVSLTAPKLCARYFKGAHHYLGGRFVPPAIRDRFRLAGLPPYPGTAMCVRVGGTAASLEEEAASAAASAKKVADMRISYERGGLEEADFVGRDPLQVFDEWFKAAVAGKVCEEPNAISLATTDSAGWPSVRVVLLKGYDERGFVFYTNYSSRKGAELGSGKAAFAIYWEKLQRQIRVEGLVEQVSEAESTEYFHSRPRGSQIGAWVSNQSQPCGSRAELEARNAELQQRYSDASQPVPKPPHWGGFLIRPTSVEFWQGRPSRLHDRIRFRRGKPDGSDPWVMERLQP